MAPPPTGEHLTESQLPVSAWTPPTFAGIWGKNQWVEVLSPSNSFTFSLSPCFKHNEIFLKKLETIQMIHKFDSLIHFKYLSHSQFQHFYLLCLILRTFIADKQPQDHFTDMKQITRLNFRLCFPAMPSHLTRVMEKKLKKVWLWPGLTLVAVGNQGENHQMEDVPACLSLFLMFCQINKNFKNRINKDSHPLRNHMYAFNWNILFLVF